MTDDKVKFALGTRLGRGFCARALEYPISVDARTLEELAAAAREAVLAQLGEERSPCFLVGVPMAADARPKKMAAASRATAAAAQGSEGL